MHVVTSSTIQKLDLENRFNTSHCDIVFRISSSSSTSCSLKYVVGFSMHALSWRIYNYIYAYNSS